jgi:hypothetical protein
VSNVIDLFPRKPREFLTLEDLAIHSTDEISENWERFAKNNRLNDYFLQAVPLWSLPQLNYLSDLNAISSVESKINLSPIINSPETSESSKLGWVAGFFIRGVRIETPVMMCEAYARCFNILLFLKLSRELTNHGII